MKVTLYRGKDGSSHEISRQDIHSLVFSKPDSGAACGGKFLSNGNGIFLGTENRSGIELYHLRNTGKVFAFSGHEA